MIFYGHADTNVSEDLIIYIEGDGHVLINKYNISSDPTPIEPIGLLLAVQHQGKDVAYLARACQFLGKNQNQSCKEAYWTSNRYSREVVQNTNLAIEEIKSKYKAKNLVLIGYSGGATMALLVAARRDDVKKIITIAGNIDVGAWVHHHNFQALSNSLDPVDYISALEKIPQIHFIGEKDEVVPLKIATKYFSHFLNASNIQLIIVPNQEHICCWDQWWEKEIRQNPF